MEFFRITRDIPFMRHALAFNVISLVTFLLAVVFLATRGLNLGVDFRGGTVIEVTYGHAVDFTRMTSGDILAMASRPGFDPNVLSRELTSKQWVEIVQDEGRPLNNRASQGQYPPGSTFKIPMAIAALETKTMSPSSTVFCNGGYQFGKRLYHDWKAGGHGYVDLHNALVHSCDVYFYTVGQRMGIDVMAEFGKDFGLGKATGVELPSERSGIMPSTAWKQKAKNEQWLPGETISAAIGQGYVTVTPLQMASLVGTVANNGVSYRPRLVQAVMDRTTGNLMEIPAVPRGKLSVKPETFRLIKDALADVVTKGTATRAKSSVVTIGGKTGTAQVERPSRIYRLADKVRVKVVRVDLDERKLDFELADAGEKPAKAKTTTEKREGEGEGKKRRNRRRRK